MGFWIALAVVLTLSGLIAYLGDSIGRRIGRKRLSLFGLRPRNTAIVFTVVTGMLIAGLAVGTVLAASKDVRNRILRYDEIISGLESQADSQRVLAAQRQAEVKRAESLLEEARRTKRQMEVELVEATRGVEVASRAKDAAEKARRAAEARARQAGRQAAAKTRELRAAQALEREARAAVRTALERREAAEKRLNAASRRLSELEEDIKKRSAELTELETELGNAAQVGKRMLEQYDAELAKLKDELEQARRERLELLEEAVRAARGRVVFDRDDELGRRRIESGLSRAEIRGRLETFIRELDRAAEQAGAGPDSQGRYAVPLHMDEAGRPVPLDVFLPAVTERLYERQEAVWLRAVSLLNAIEGRPVYYGFEYYVDRVVFYADQVIARIEIDGRQDEAAIALQLEQVLRDGVAPEAEKRGMLPSRQRRIGPEVWFPVVREIRQRDRLVTVEVLAARSIRIGDPLSLAFRIADHGP